jgi:thymidine kinase
MWASKSTELIKRIKQYTVIKKKILVINHVFDNRYSIKQNDIKDDSKNYKNKSNDLTVKQICTHDQIPYPAVMCDKLELILPIVIEYDIILIDESQFFEDLYKIVLQLVDTLNKTVILAGLSGDFNKCPIGQILLLIPHADKITQLSALCVKCSDGTLAHFTKKKNSINHSLQVGGKELYEPVCRKHYSVL